MLEHGRDGHIDLESAASASGCCAVYVEQPSAFGILDAGLTELKAIVGGQTALIVGVDVVSLGIVEPPGRWGADIVVGEGQPFGIGPTGGGPIYGVFACSKRFRALSRSASVGASLSATLISRAASSTLPSFFCALARRKRAFMFLGSRVKAASQHEEALR